MAIGTRIYVGNLAFSTTDAALREAFARDGRTVSEVKVVTDRDTGQPRGFAFLEMGSPADAESAIAALDGQELDGRTLKVNIAKERPASGRNGSRF